MSAKLRIKERDRSVDEYYSKVPMFAFNVNYVLNIYLINRAYLNIQAPGFN